MDYNATKSVLPSKEALLEFLKTHKYKSLPTAIDAARMRRSGGGRSWCFSTTTRKPTATAAITTARKMTPFTPNT